MKNEEIIVSNSSNNFVNFMETPIKENLIFFLVDKRENTKQNSQQLRFLLKQHKKNGDSPSSKWENLSCKNQKKFIIDKEILSFSTIIDNKGHLLLLFSYLAPQFENKKLIENSNSLQLDVLSSPRYGKEWMDCKPLSDFEDDLSSFRIHHNPIILEKSLSMGTILVPIEDTMMKRSAVLISSDNGISWYQSHFIENEEMDDDWDDDMDLSTYSGSYSLAITERPDGKVCGFFKMYNKNGLFTSLSGNGQIWNEPKPLVIENFDADNAFDLISLGLPKTKSNNEDKIQPAHTLLVGWDSTTHLLTLWVSKDETLDFKSVWNAKNGEPESIEYVHLYQDSDSIIHVVYKSDINLISHYSWKVAELL